MRRNRLILGLLFAAVVGLSISDVSTASGHSQEVLEAAQAGDWSRVRSLLEKNPASIGVRNARGASLLHLAASDPRQDKDLVLFLLTQGADIDALDENATTPIFWAAQNGRQEIASLLLARGADFRRKDKFETTLLHRASYGGCLALAEDLLAKGLDPDALEYRGQTPLHWAVMGKKLPVLDVLLARGARVDSRDRNGSTPFLSAVGTGFTDGAERLVAGGADPNQKDAFGSSALHLGHRDSRPDFFQWLLQNGANVDIRDAGGQTPLLIAAFYGRKDLAVLFLARGAEVDAADNRGRTPLLQAAISGYSALAESLIERGADVNAKDAGGNTPLDFARRYGNRGMASLLAAHGARAVRAAMETDSPVLLKKTLEDGEAGVWNLGGASWAVKTKTCLLIFDYWEFGEKPDIGSLSNGRIDPEEIRGFPVYVFSSHVHFDHFDKVILTWEKTVPRITYVFGFKPFQEARYHYFLDDQQTRIIDGLEISNVRDGSGGEAGVAFLVRTEGLTIYYGDDYKGRASGPESLEYLVRKNVKVDLAFLRMDEISRAASTFVLKKLKPKIVFPMHAVNREFLFERQAREFGNESPETRFVCSLNRGDRYFYRNGKIEF